MIIANLNNMNDGEKDGFRQMMEQMLVRQAVRQHMEVCENWEHGRVVKYWFEEPENDDRILCVEYESGTWFHYRGIDLGSDGMEYW